MVRLSVETIDDSYQFINAVKQREICLRNLQIPAIENLGATRDQFDVIDLTDNNIRKVDNFPLLNRLDTLLLHNNRIQQIQRDLGEKLPHLKTLALTNNNIAELGDIDSLAQCTKLEYLTLVGNPLTNKPQYRAYVIYKLKALRVLDFRRIKDVERKAAMQLFKGKQGQQLREQLVKKTHETADDERLNANGRSTEERDRIEEAIKSAKTLIEVENLQSLLQSGKLPGAELHENGNGDIIDGGMIEEEEEQQQQQQLEEMEIET